MCGRWLVCFDFTNVVPVHKTTQTLRKSVCEFVYETMTLWKISKSKARYLGANGIIFGLKGVIFGLNGVVFGLSGMIFILNGVIFGVKDAMAACNPISLAVYAYCGRDGGDLWRVLTNGARNLKICCHLSAVLV